MEGRARCLSAMALATGDPHAARRVTSDANNAVVTSKKVRLDIGGLGILRENDLHEPRLLFKRPLRTVGKS
jgi:hypothetical protein